MLDYQNYINELFEDTVDSFSVMNPHTREKIGELPTCNEEQMKQAIEKADQAFKQTKSMTSHERSEILDRASEIIAENKTLFAETMAKESAKPLKFVEAEVDRTVETFKFSAIEARKLEGETIRLDAAPNGEGRDAYTIYQPVGVIGAITPFNFPINLVSHKVGPAIGTGNTIIVKPAKKTPLSSFLLREAVIQAGFPEDGFQVITGDGSTLGKVLLESEAVKKITFTGSPEVGKKLKEDAGLKKMTLELGNNSAVYVDTTQKDRVEDIAGKAVVGAYAFNGQVCISTQRIYVHEDIAESFVEEFKKQTVNLKYGDPLDKETDVSALIDEESQMRILDWLKEAEEQGAKIVTGGKKHEYGIEPTVVVDVPKEAKILSEEVFGPVVIINTVKNGEQALMEMNDTKYGLSAGIFTQNLSQAITFGHELDVGQVLVNDLPTLRFDHMPYGGRNDSGYGFEGVKYAMKGMVNRKFISLNYTF
ncbi:aldehyde dehydrogenase family protein [Halalkalibacillus halophilus]|uniref:aldehyde dehydrogenase family protein n=1 Tax=Halalkalibacillus halophilus TaxID=392827 RepID=UPI0003F782B7|nr:aldehyde dehydrogenase family protein [Halalkalibacillus halophilus]